MAITKVVFTGETRADQYEEVLDFMETYAADLFDDITGDAQSGKIFCNKRTDVPMGALTLCCDTGSYIAYLFAPRGTSYSVESMSVPSGVKFDYGVATSKGIYINWTISSNLPTSRSGIFISKSINNTPYAVFMFFDNTTSNGRMGNVDLGTTDVNPDYGWISKIWDGYSDFYVCGNSTTMQATYTALNPVVSQYAQSYTPHIYQMHFNQFPQQEGKLTLNGYSYYTNGYFALAD